MASIIPIGNKFRAQVRRKGMATVTKTFDNKKEAGEWATAQEALLISGKKIGANGKTGITVSQAIDRYLEERDNLSRSTVYPLRRIQASVLGDVPLHKLNDDHIFNYIESLNISPIGGHTIFSPLCSVLKKARVGWKYKVQDIVSTASERLIEMGLVGPSEKRTRRPTEKELEMLLAHKTRSKIPMHDIIRFAIATAMRCSEITRIEWSTFAKEDATVLITKRKHPTKKETNNQDVPLLQTAIEIIERQKKLEFDDRIFPYNSRTVGQLFAIMCNDLGIEDLHFHDLRHEGASRLIEMGYRPDQVKMFTGHESMQMLERYTHLKAKDMPKLDGKKIEQSKTEPVAVQSGAVVMDAETMKQFKMFQTMMASMKQTESA